MQEWNEIVQCMIDWIEEHLDQDPILCKVSQEVGYSPWYCSVIFHDVTGLTLKNYVAGRRLSLATVAIRDTKERILDIAIQFGYSSQEALSRAFKDRYGCTPAAYRKNPIPIPMAIPKQVLFPKMNAERLKKMEEKRLDVRVEHIPAHKYLGIWEERAENYGDFWKYHNCDKVCGFIDSMDKMAHPIVTAHTAGWVKSGDKKTYFYGLGIPLEYAGKIPDGFSEKEIPASDYLVFAYPAFDYLEENNEVMPAVENLAWGFDPAEIGYEWNEEACPIYQRHYPEKLGYQVLRPVRKCK